MGAIGYAEFRPIASNDNEENRQKNRRVVIRMLAGEDVYANSSPFADSQEGVEGTQQAVVNELQPAEPVRSIFEAP